MHRCLTRLGTARRAAAAVLAFAALLPVWAAVDLTYRLPTDNDALFRGDNDGFFMYCDRNFEGQHTQPWEAGTFGMVRNPFRTSDGQMMFNRIHEGIDIKPLVRDAKGEPQDMVRPLAPGVVVYANTAPGASNYGRYVVVSHTVPEGTIYTLYAHLASITCAEGQYVGTGNELGRLGYSGKGLNKTRAHVHVEVCLMINAAYDRFSPPANKHGLYNGLNLAGMNTADILLHCKDGEPLSLSAYMAGLQEHYRVRVPARGTMDILHRHPFLYKGDWSKRPAALDMAFTAEGIPIAVYPADESVSEPRIVSCKPMPTLQQNCTVNRVKNSSANAALTVSGKNYIKQFLWLPGLDAAPAAAEQEP